MLVFLFSAVLASLLAFVFYLLARWALHGEGYWPRGILGVFLALVFIFGIPCAVWAFFTALKAKKPIYWIVPPLHNTRSDS